MAPDGIRVHYREELERLEGRALDGLDLVIAALDRAVEAVQHQDIELAELVIADDDVIDGRYLEIHQAILTLLATQAPVATDLRLIAALLHVMKNIERMGDQCVNIAKLIPIAGHEPPADEQMLKNLVTMGKSLRGQIRQAKRAFADRDIDMARDLVRQDDVIDNLNKECFRRAIEIGDELDRREWAMTMMLVARALERIGDNAVDVGEQVAFLVTGLFREFEDASHPGEGRPPPALLGLVRRRPQTGGRALSPLRRRPPPAERRPRPRGSAAPWWSGTAPRRGGDTAGAPRASGAPGGRRELGASRPHGRVPRPGGRWRSSLRGSTPLSAPLGCQRAPRLSWRWNSVTVSSTGSISASSEVWRRSATMWAWPRSRQMPRRSEPIRLARPRRTIGLADRGSGPGKTGARFSIAIVTPSRSARSDRAASERASNSSASSLSGASGRSQAW